MCVLYLDDYGWILHISTTWISLKFHNSKLILIFEVVWRYDDTMANWSKCCRPSVHSTCSFWIGLCVCGGENNFIIFRASFLGVAFSNKYWLIIYTTVVRCWYHGCSKEGSFTFAITGKTIVSSNYPVSCLCLTCRSEVNINYQKKATVSSSILTKS